MGHSEQYDHYLETCGNKDNSCICKKCKFALKHKNEKGREWYVCVTRQKETDAFDVCSMFEEGPYNHGPKEGPKQDPELVAVTLTESGDKLRKFVKKLDKLYSTFEKKNHDYNDAYSQEIDRLGFAPVVGRIFEKYVRAEAILVKGTVPLVDEAVEETLLDIAGTCLALAVEIDRRNGK